MLHFFYFSDLLGHIFVMHSIKQKPFFHHKNTSHDSINYNPLLDNGSDVNYTTTTDEDYTTQDDILPYTFTV